MIRSAMPAAALVAAAVLAGPAHAAFPGTNGKVAFQRNQTAGTDQVHVADSDGSDRVQVTRPQHYMHGTDGFVQPSFSPDGTRLVVLGQSGGHLWTVYANGAQLRKLDGALTNQQVAEQPTYTPDGSRILFGLTDMSDPQNPVPKGIHSVRASDGGDLRQHTAGNDFDPAMSPDGTKLAFGRNVSGGGTSASLFVAGADGGNPVAIYEGHGMDEYPNSMNWSPDSQSIVFGKYQNGIFVIPAAGGEPRTISPRCDDPAGCGYDSQPVYSPDGTKILFGRTYLGKVGESNTLTLYSAPADGLGASSALFAGTTDSGPSWGVHTTATLPEPEPDATSGKPNTDGPGGIAPGGGGTTTTVVTDDGVGLDARVLTVRGRRGLGALFTRRGLQVPVGVSVAGTVRLDAYTTRGKARRMAGGTASAGRAGVVMVRLRATKAGRRLRRARSLKLQIRGSFRSTKGQSVRLRARRVTLTRS